MADGMSAVELASGFRVKFNERGINATRVFITSSSNAEGSVAPTFTATIPVIGENFVMPVGVADFGELITSSKLFCRDIDIAVFADDSTKLQYTCTYSNEPTDSGQYEGGGAPSTDPVNLPLSLDYTSEFVLWNPPQDEQGLSQSNWVWNGTTNKIIEPIAFGVRTTAMKIQRVILGTDYVGQATKWIDYTGKVNSNESGQFTGEGCWMFVGAQTENFNNYLDNPAFKAELTFVFRDVDGTNVDGWNKILTKSGGWNIPYNTVTQQKIYQSANFDDLLT